MAALTSFWPDWIEAFGWDPDHGDGSLEWALVGAFGVLAVIADRYFHPGGGLQQCGFRLPHREAM